MNKILSILFATFISFVIFSCTSPDPAALYGLTPNDPNNPGANIAGPRIITKVDSAGVTIEEYFSTPSGLLQAVVNKVGDTTAIAYNSNNKINKIIYTSSTAKMETKLYYDSSGKVSQITNETFAGIQTVSFQLSELEYNASGKVSKITQKLAFTAQPVNTDWTHYKISKMTYSGENLTKIEEENGFVTNNVFDPPNPQMGITYLIENFDNKINPMTTLPKEYHIGRSALHSVSLIGINYNNAMKSTIIYEFFPSNPIITTVNDMVYDSYNYPISAENGVRKIYYKPIQ